MSILSSARDHSSSVGGVVDDGGLVASAGVGGVDDGGDVGGWG